MYSFVLNPNIIPEAPENEQWEEKFVNWGRLSVLSGSIEIRFYPVAFGSRIPGLGPNAVNMDDLKDLVEEMTALDIKRTVRNVLK